MDTKPLNEGSRSSRGGRRFRKWVIIVLIVLVVLYLVIGAYAASTLTEVKEHPQYSDTPATFGLAYEDVRFTARGDDVEIAAWYLPHEGSTRAVILVHGTDASKQNAISGTYVKFASSLNKAGFAVLMIDLRAHGESEGERYSFGVYERRDVLGAVDWLLDQGFKPGSIGTLGISLGASATIGATAEDTAIGVMVVDSAFADIAPLIELKWEEASGLPMFFLPGVYLMNQILYGYDLGGIRPVDEIVDITPRPILILHCTTDIDVDISHAEQLAEAVPHAETWYIEGCDHAEVYRDFPQEYEEHVITFFEENLK